MTVVIMKMFIDFNQKLQDTVQKQRADDTNCNVNVKFNQ